jgi:putative GTP pyrophosphokinase
MIDPSLELIERRLKAHLVQELSRTGLLFRLFSRVKEPTSIKEKFTRKTYSADERKMQDLVGFRITTYFSDDLKIVVELCSKIFDVVGLEYDIPNAEEFKPLRKNMVCRMPEDQDGIFKELARSSNEYQLIDNTFEIQFRTTLSEGWHEVEHLMRYKCKSDWTELTEESRMLNGIYATLETNDQALKALFDDISYHHYKFKQWEAMLRNKLRLRFNLESLDSEIISHLNVNPEIGRRLFKLNRNRMINDYINSTLSFPTTFDNWMFFINYAFLKDEFILSKTPEFLMEDFKLALNGQEAK